MFWKLLLLLIQPFHPTFQILGNSEFPKLSSSIAWICQCGRERTVSCQPATFPYQCLPLPTSSWVKKLYLTQVELLMTKAPEGKLTKMSVPLSIFMTSPRQGSHSSNTGIRVKLLYLWLFTQWTKIFARLKKNIFGCTNRGMQEQANPKGEKEQNKFSHWKAKVWVGCGSLLKELKSP